MDELYSCSAFADCGCDPFDGSMAHVAHSKDARNAGFKPEWVSIDGPALGAMSFMFKLCACQNETVVVGLHHTLQVLGVRQSSDINEQRMSGIRLLLICCTV